MYNISISFNKTFSSFEDIVKMSSYFNINNIEIGHIVDNIEITSIDGASVERYRNILISSFKKIVSINVNEPVYNDVYYKKLFRIAHFLRVENVNLHIDENDISDSIINATRLIVKIGKSYDIGVLFENSSTSFLNNDKILTEFYKKIRDDNTGVIFNPLEYSKMKSHPFFHEYYNSKIKKEISVLRINDGLFVDGSVTLPGKGNAEVKELVSILIAIGFNGYFSIVPYFNDMNLDKYNEVVNDLKSIFKSI